MSSYSYVALNTRFHSTPSPHLSSAHIYSIHLPSIIFTSSICCHFSASYVYIDGNRSRRSLLRPSMPIQSRPAGGKSEHDRKCGSAKGFSIYLVLLRILKNELSVFNLYGFRQIKVNNLASMIRALFTTFFFPFHLFVVIL